MPPGEGPTIYERAQDDATWLADGRAGPRVLRFGLISHRQRWAHRLWPAAQVLAAHLDAHPEHARGRAVLEVGAGAALPSVVAGLLGACAVVTSDWPDARMLANTAANLNANLAPEMHEMHQRVMVVGYDWNTPPHPLLGALDAIVSGGARAAPCGVRVLDLALDLGFDRGAEAHILPEQPRRFDLILMSDLLYECEHEALLRAIVCCLSRSRPVGAAPGAEPRAVPVGASPHGSRAVPGSASPHEPRAVPGGASPHEPRVLLTYQVHDRCQAARQGAFFTLVPAHGLVATQLRSVDVGRQFEDKEEEAAEEAEAAEGVDDEQDDITRQVQLWELTWAPPGAPTAPSPEADDENVSDAADAPLVVGLVRVVRSRATGVATGRSSWRFV